jgi:trimethylamine monooxygenase
MFDAQGWWMRDAIMGRIAIPNKKTMEANLYTCINAEKAFFVDHYTHIDYQGANIKELSSKMDYQNFNISK